MKNSKTFSIENAVIVCEDFVFGGAIDVNEGRIVAIRKPGEKAAQPSETQIDAQGAYLAPGFIDLHIHGLHEFLVDNGPEHLAAIAKRLPRYGVTGWLPTVSPRPRGEDSQFLATLAQTQTTGAAILGFHLEGPFLAITGALPPEALGASDATRVTALQAAAAPYRAIFSISPEVPGIADWIPLMHRDGTPVFITHTRASVRQTQLAIEAGATHATHFYDVFPAPPETEPGVRPCGVVEAVMADPRVTVDFILDGIHVDPVAVQMALACKGPRGVCLITDAMVGAGSPPGRHHFGGLEVEFAAPGAPARMTENARNPGSLAGSGLTMNLAVRNAVRLAGTTLPQAIRMASANPARVLGLAEATGALAVGRQADLVLLDDQFEVLQTWVFGESVYCKGDA
ncbi:MAG: N-acetylglucosamine-6-phosphate deacetylase [Kiritimatiellia bacterium]|jgi:N-acetylglucosamine-6-phosphate deacetylase